MIKLTDVITPAPRVAKKMFRIAKPIDPFNRAARVMLFNAATYSPNLDSSILKFLKLSNKQGMQSHGVVAFFSELNSIRKNNPRSLSYELIEYIEERVSKNSVLKRHADVFMGRFKRNYPKHFADRLTLANYDCVNSSGVKKQNVWKKLLVKTMSIMR